MKRFLPLLAGIFALQASAQLTLQGSKFTDNWSVGISSGAVTPLRHAAFFGGMRPTFGLELTKMLNPALGVAFEGRTSCNATPGHTAFDGVAANLLGKLVLNNVLTAYTGRPRRCEAGLVAGAGYLRRFGNNGGTTENWSMKTGFDIALNLGAERNWLLHFRPAVVFEMDPDGHTLGWTREHAALELTAGVAYRLANSNGTHHFAIARLRDVNEIDALNAKINDLRHLNESKDAQIARLKRQNQRLHGQEGTATDRPGPAARPATPQTGRRLESTVSFRVGKADVEPSQLPNIERVAAYMKQHESCTVRITGYASPEGNAETNRRLSRERAAAVAALLTGKFGVAAERIYTESAEKSLLFCSPEWNRVAVCTLIESNE